MKQNLRKIKRRLSTLNLIDVLRGIGSRIDSYLLPDDLSRFFFEADTCLRTGSLEGTLRAVEAFEHLAFREENKNAKLFWKRLLVSTRRLRDWRIKTGRLRSVWGVTPIASLKYLVAGDRNIGVRSESLVFTQYYTTSEFDINLSKIQEYIIKERVDLFYAFRMYVHAWSLIKYDIFHLYNDRGLVEPAGGYGSDRFGIALIEMQDYAGAGKALFTYAYGADFRLRQKTLAGGKWNMCMDCPEPGRFCLCDDEGGQKTLSTIAANATRMNGLGLSMDFLPGAHLMRYNVVDTEELSSAPDAVKLPSGMLRIGHFPNHGHFKGTRFLDAAVDELRSRGVSIELVKLSGLPRATILQEMKKVDVVVDQLISGSFGLTAVEAMALGVPVVAYIRPGVAIPAPEECPIIRANPDTIGQLLEELSRDRGLLAEARQRGPEYVANHFSMQAFEHDLRELYTECIPGLSMRRVKLQAIKNLTLGQLRAAIARRVQRFLSPAIRVLRRVHNALIRLFLPLCFRIYISTASSLAHGSYALELRGRLNPQQRQRRRAPGEALSVFHGLYSTVQPTILSHDLRSIGWKSVYETFDYNPGFVAPDAVRSDVFHPDFYFEQVEFRADGLSPRWPAATDSFNLKKLEGYFESRWGAYDVYHFNWFLSFLPDQLDVEYLRRSGSAVYFHFRGCFILTRLAPEFAAQGKSVADACSACKARGWREEYFRRFQRGVREASRVFVSTPNLCHCSPAFEYLPLSLDAETAAISPARSGVRGEDTPVFVMHAPSSAAMESVKGTPHVQDAIRQLQNEGFNVELVMVQNMSRREAIMKFGEADIFVEQLTLGSYGNTAIEAMAQGVPVISSNHPDHAHLVPDCPVVHADPTTITDRLRELLIDSTARVELGRRCAAFVREFHGNKNVAEHVNRIYLEDLGRSPRRAPNNLSNREPEYGA
jgi:glycosyltransferase involved in cell wall biosynthesis